MSVGVHKVWGGGGKMRAKVVRREMGVEIQIRKRRTRNWKRGWRIRDEDGFAMQNEGRGDGAVTGRMA